MNTLYQRLAGESISDALLRLEADIKARPADADLRAAFVQFSDPQRQLGARPDATKELAGAEAAGKTDRNAAGAGHSG